MISFVLVTPTGRGIENQQEQQIDGRSLHDVHVAIFDVCLPVLVSRTCVACFFSGA
jgi:hypothetical protein